MAEPIEFDTLRLRLRQWRDSDRQPFARLNADPTVMAYFPSPLTVDKSNAMAEGAAAGIAERGWGFWAVELRESGQFIGMVGLNIPHADLPFSPCVEVGWRLARQHWGQGYAIEAASAVLHIAFERLELAEIVSFTTQTNLRSQAVMKKLGMKLDGEFEHPMVAEETGLRQHLLYRLTRSEWLNQHNLIKVGRSRRRGR